MVRTGSFWEKFITLFTTKSAAKQPEKHNNRGLPEGYVID